MISIENIEKNVASYGFQPIVLLDFKSNNYGEIDSKDIDSFLKLIKQENGKHVYLVPFYYDKRDYYIDPYYDDDYSDFIQKNIKFREYEKKLEEFDFGRPRALEVIARYEDLYLIYRIEDDWFDEDNLGKSGIESEIKSEFEDSYYEEVLKKRRETREKYKKEKEEVERIILNDPEFVTKKNQDSRYWYFHDLMDKEEMIKYQEIFLPYGAPHTGNVKLFMDEVWAKFKEIQKNSKK